MWGQASRIVVLVFNNEYAKPDPVCKDLRPKVEYLIHLPEVFPKE